MQKQNIWRTVSVIDHNGVFVWEVMEYEGNTEPVYMKESFVQCRDGSWVLPICYHYWTTEKAETHLNDQLTAFSIYHTI